MILHPHTWLRQIFTRRSSALAVPYLLVGAVIILIAAADAGAILHLREDMLHNTERTLESTSRTLAEQAERSLQSLDLVLADVMDDVRAAGVTDSASYRSRMSGYDTHMLLTQRARGLPMVNAVTMIDADGNLINFSRYWPIPPVNVADRDYFQILKNGPTRSRFIGVPVQNRGDGTWTVYLARRLNGPKGNFVGLMLGAIELTYFEDFYRSVVNSDAEAISLIRQDGVLLARYPRTNSIGRAMPEGGGRALNGGVAGAIRDLSPVDGKMRIKAAHMLSSYPLFVLTTITEAAALGVWRSAAIVLGLAGAGFALVLSLMVVGIHRWWHQQQSMARIETERTEADRARALAETELLRERERHAREANRAKSGFLAVMSHEIRTPMNAVLGLTGTLLDEPLPEQQREVVEAIRDAGDDLLRILNDILDYSKLEAGRMTFEALVFCPESLSHNIGSMLGPRAAAKGLIFSIASDPDLPPALFGDAGRIRQVLLNLCGNAVKFTEAGEVALEARCISRTSETATVEWQVRDTGIGIPPDKLDKLFAEFAQADDSISRRFGGSGLGLAISKRLVEQMGGDIGVEFGAGQRHLFPLPGVAAAGIDARPGSASQARRGGAVARRHPGARPPVAGAAGRRQPDQPVRGGPVPQGIRRPP